MPPGQIHHVDIVPYACAVRRVVVVAENTQLRQLAHRHLSHIRHQIVRNALGILADFSARMRADGVEVPKQNHAPLGIGSPNIGQNLLQHPFGPSVGIGTHALGARLGDWHKRRIAVHRGRGAENDFLHPVPAHYVRQRQRPVQVVRIVLDGFFHRFAHGLVPREMNHRVEIVRVKNLLQGCPVYQICLIEYRRFPRDLPDPFHGFRAGIVKIVNNHDIVPVLKQFHAGMAPDVSRAPGNKNLHIPLFLLPVLPSVPGRGDGSSVRFHSVTVYHKPPAGTTFRPDHFILNFIHFLPLFGKCFNIYFSSNI